MSILDIFKDENKTQRDAEEFYQIREYESQLWLTFNGNLICPCSMLKDEPVVALNVMRKMYVERNSK